MFATMKTTSIQTKFIARKRLKTEIVHFVFKRIQFPYEMMKENTNAMVISSLKLKYGQRDIYNSFYTFDNVH